MRRLTFQSKDEAVEALNRIGVDPYGIGAMVPKMRHLNLLVEGLECKVANIMKQEMLSLGGDVAVARGSVDCSIEKTGALIIGTRKQVERFAEKLAAQPFGLKAIAREIQELLRNIERGAFVLKTPRREIALGGRTLIMGILNVTPDSFSDGGSFNNEDEAVAHGVRLEAEGADMLDIGGESSRPGAHSVSVEEEIRRVVPVIEKLSKRIGIPISVDTTKSAVAEAALNAGAEIINDISALRSDVGMAGIAARYETPVVLMHMRGIPETMQKGDLHYGDLFAEIIAFLRERIEGATVRGVDPEKIVIDPGIGFGKSAGDNLRLLKNLAELRILGRPMLVGTSRKSFIGSITGGDPKHRLEGTAASVTTAVMNGAHIVRVHDVGFMKGVVSVADAIVRG